jgi:hypothetical protein
MNIYVCMYVHMYAGMCALILYILCTRCMFMYLRMYVVCMFVCMCTYIRRHSCMCACIYMSVICACMYVCIHYVFMHV